MPEISTHPSAEALALFGHGKLSEAQAATVAAHLETCADCREAAANLPTDSFLDKMRDAQPSMTVPPRDPESEALRGAVSPPAADVPPELANHPKFSIVRRLGKGGMGVIYLALHRVLQKPFALKVISPAVLDNPDILARFHAEARAAAQLDHPNIARAHDADQAGELHFLVMEYVEGMSLAQLLEKRGPLSVASACHCVCQAALGLQHACERGMVHRDIKPQNLMLTPKGQIKVLDFGLARLRGERKEGGRLTRADSFMGTPEYVAPEQATDARTADIRADIYSLGCTLYALLIGRPPFQEETMVKLVLAHIEQEPTPLRELRPDVPAEVAAVAAKMLAKDPAQRYQRPIDVAQTLAPFAKAVSKVRPAGTAPAPQAGAGTVVGGDTSRVKEPSGGVSKPRSRKPAATMTQTPFANLVDPAPGSRAPKDSPSKGRANPTAQPTWWKRPAVLASGGALVLLLVGLGVAGLLWMKARHGAELAGSVQPRTMATADAGPGSSQAAAPLSEIARARAELERARSDARQKLLASFDATLKRLAKTDDAADQSSLLAIVRAERTRFEKRGLLPWSEPMRASMLAYWHTVRAARDAIEQAYNVEIDLLAKQDKNDRVDQLRTELGEVLGDEVVARWNHQPPGNAAVISLLIDGKIKEDSTASWSFDEEGVLRLRWPNGDAPGGVWIDTCQVSPDGSSYAGENNNLVRRAPIRGAYADED